MSEEKKDSDVFNYLLSRKINDYEKKYIDEEHVMMEIIYSINRAGADAIITYHALEIANALKKDLV